MASSEEEQRGPSLDVVVPVYNEAEGLPRFHGRLAQALESLDLGRARILYVDDGSSDATPEVLRALAAEDPRVHVVTLSRNFGHQAALTAGLDRAEADVVVTIDADGQHPPELIDEMLDLYRSGYEVVLTQRVEGGEASRFKRWSAALFYRLMNLISGTKMVPGAADFRLLSRKVVEGLRAMPEYHRFLRGMIAWMGYRTVILPYAPGARIAGESKYSLRKMLRLAFDAAFSFSLVPLFLGLVLGGMFLLLALAEVVYVSWLWLSGNRGVLHPGWSSLMFMLLIVGGTLSVILGILGIYIGYIFQEVKRRPVYLVREEIPGRVPSPAEAPGPPE